jgi:hypothetical protein
MITLKLAKYERGKLQGFLELYNICGFQRETTFLLGQDSIRIIQNEIFGDYWNYEKDKKDPLNRFNGLFHGRTYGQGDFVLIQDDEDNIFKRVFYDGWEDIIEYSMTKKEDGEWQLAGNLHQNPELYEKIKNI